MGEPGVEKFLLKTHRWRKTSIVYGYPKGKPNRNESEWDCAVREVSRRNNTELR